MKLISAIAAPERLNRIQEELGRVEVFRLTVSDVVAVRGREAGAPGLTFDSQAAVRLEIAVNENFVQPTLDALFRALGEEGDGEVHGAVYVMPLRDVIRIRTGERGPEAI